MRRFNITVNGKAYDVAVEEVNGAAPALWLRLPRLLPPLPLPPLLLPLHLRLLPAPSTAPR